MNYGYCRCVQLLAHCVNVMDYVLAGTLSNIMTGIEIEFGFIINVSQ